MSAADRGIRDLFRCHHCGTDFGSQIDRIEHKLDAHNQKVGQIMGVLEDLQTADAALAVASGAVATNVAALATEQSVFLNDISTALAAAGTDPAALAAVALDINAKAADLTAQASNLQALAAAQVAADPATTAVPEADGGEDAPGVTQPVDGDGTGDVPPVE